MKFWMALICVVLGVVVLLRLGFWQVERLAWKQDLMAKVALYQAESVDLAAYLADENGEFRRGYVDGVWDAQGSFATKPRLMDGQIGYWIVSPLDTSDGQRVMVNRGWVADGMQERVLAHDLPTGRVRVYGTIRQHGALADYAPVRDGGLWVLFMERSAPADHRELIPAPVQATLRNEHRNYAIFWFTMAVILAGLGGFSLLKMRSASSRGPSGL